MSKHLEITKAVMQIARPEQGTITISGSRDAQTGDLVFSVFCFEDAGLVEFDEGYLERMCELRQHLDDLAVHGYVFHYINTQVGRGFSTMELFIPASLNPSLTPEDRNETVH